MKISSISLLIVIATILSGCSTEESWETPSDDNGKVNNLWITGLDSVSEYNAVLINAKKDFAAFVKDDENSNMNEVSFLYNNCQDLMVVQLDGNGRIESLGGDSLMLTFANYEESMVDIALVYQNHVFLLEDYDTGVNWENTSTLINRVPRARNTFSDFASDVERWQQDLYNLSNNYGWLISSTTSLTNIIRGGAGTSALEGKALEEAEKKLVKQMAEWQGNLILDAVETALPESEYGNVSLSRMALEGLSIAGIVSGSSVGLALIAAISSYSSVVDFAENTTLLILEAMEWYKSSKSMGLGALQSGIGTLKATLTWDFYADIDLHAYEPDGSHIFYMRKYGTNGYLDVDNRKGGSGATENIYWENPTPGTYSFILDHYGRSTSTGLAQNGTCKLTIFYKGVGRVFNIPLSKGETKGVTQITLPSGYFENYEENQANTTVMHLPRKQQVNQ